MDAVSIILSVAKAVGVSGPLLVAICSHESMGFTKNYNPRDNGSPSIGYCQLKYATAKLVGFKGKPKDLMDVRTNAYWAAKYLSKKEELYGDNWVKLVAAYNSGTYNPSEGVVGCPRNLGYIKLVKKKLPESLKKRLDCGK